MNAKSTGRAFANTNIVLHLLSKDPAKAQRAREMRVEQSLVIVNPFVAG